MNVSSLINQKINFFKNPHYLEIGVRNGETFFSIKRFLSNVGQEIFSSLAIKLKTSFEKCGIIGIVVIKIFV